MPIMERLAAAATQNTGKVAADAAAKSAARKAARAGAAQLRQEISSAAFDKMGGADANLSVWFDSLRVSSKSATEAVVTGKATVSDNISFQTSYIIKGIFDKIKHAFSSFDSKAAGSITAPPGGL